MRQQCMHRNGHTCTAEVVIGESGKSVPLTAGDALLHFNYVKGWTQWRDADLHKDGDRWFSVCIICLKGITWLQSLGGWVHTGVIPNSHAATASSALDFNPGNDLNAEKNFLRSPSASTAPQTEKRENVYNIDVVSSVAGVRGQILAQVEGKYVVVWESSIVRFYDFKTPDQARAKARKKAEKVLNKVMLRPFAEYDMEKAIRKATDLADLDYPYNEGNDFFGDDDSNDVLTRDQIAAWLSIPEVRKEVELQLAERYRRDKPEDSPEQDAPERDDDPPHD